VLEVTLEGAPDPDTGFVYDLGELGALVRKVILDDVDHRNLNVDVDWLRGAIPTAENLVSAFWDRLEPNLPPGLLRSVRLQETGKNRAERER
jgi:6-pyruvoyltetrahydropterin/6-carboxytetrahydropterin synthase